MSNVIDSIIANKPIYPANKQAGNNTTFTFSTDNKIKPMQYKGKLLPSRIFQTPVEYAKDVKGDILNIGKAAKGKANDHELGRINDLAMRVGSGALALYLFTNKSMKLNKAMEFIGPVAFFSSMALWPKLFIQAPVRARTGVDIHQKYIDSQGRKKMLFQDPQYVLTDLYSKEDLEKIGDKLGVSKDLPDRDNFIKQRAQKTALQGNTLWMMTAGVAPIMSALLCNRLEIPTNWAIEKTNLALSKFGLNKVVNAADKSEAKGLAQRINDKSFERFLSKNADKEVTNETIKELIDKIGSDRIGTKTLSDKVKAQITKAEEQVAASKTRTIDVKKAVEDAASRIKTKLEKIPTDQQQAGDKFAKETLEKIVENIDDIIPTSSEAYNDAVASCDTKKIAQIITNRYLKNTSTRGEREKVAKEIERSIGKIGRETPKGTVKISEIADEARKLRSSVSGFVSQQRKLDKFVSARVGEEANNQIANQWNKVWNSLLGSLHFSQKELRDLANDGDVNIIYEKLKDIASDEKKYSKVIEKLSKSIETYEKHTNAKTFSADIQSASEKITNNAKAAMEAGFGDDAARILDDIANETIRHAENRASGARNSFYRLIHALEVFKQATPADGQPSKLAEQLKTNLKKYSDLSGKELDDAVERLVKRSKKMVFDASTTDHIEKLTTQGYQKLSEGEYKALMETLFNSESSILSNADEKVVEGFKQYKKDFMEKIVNWDNNMTQGLSYRKCNGGQGSLNGLERANTVASEVTEAVKKAANNKYNSNKWLKIFGISFAAIAAVTLTAGLFIGRKSDMEKQVEKESKVNG